MNRIIPDDEYEKKQGKRAVVKAIRQGFIIQAQSGKGLLCSDPDAFQCFLPPSADEETLGRSLLSALAASRYLRTDEARSFAAEVMDRQSKWVAYMLAATGISTEQRLFQHMASCSVSAKEDVIAFSPTVKQRGAAWKGLGKEYETNISMSAHQSEIGAALKEALRNCVPSVVK